MDISLIVPVYNEKESLPLLQDKINTAMTALGLSWELIYIDDGSTDGSTQVLRDLQTQADNITLAVMRRNRGKSQALYTGFALAQGEIILTMDSDLQDEPEEIKNLLARLNEGYDVAVGWKKERHDPITKRFPSWIANRATRLATGVHLHDMNSGLKAIRADVVHQIHVYGDLHRYIPIIAYYEGFKVTEIPVVHHPRQFGHSKFGVGRLIRGGLDLLTVVFLNNYRYRPSHLFGAVGGVLFSLGFLINLYLTIEWFRGVRPIGDRPLLTLGVLLMVIGVQLITTGLLAELLVSYIQSREDPLSPVRQIFRPPSDNGQ